MQSRRPGPRGFTMVELLVVLAVTVVGFVALLKLQIGTLHGAGASRDQQNAINLAEHVGQTMQIEALQWTPASGELANSTFTYLKNAPTDTNEGSATEWLKAFPGTGGAGKELYVSPVGNDAAYDSGAIGLYSGGTGAFNAEYCVHYRLTWLIPDVLLRADIRVMWLRNDAAWGDYKQCPLNMADNLHDVNSVTTPVSILRNVFVKQVGG